MGLLSDIAGASLGAIGTVYNLYTNERDFDYQKALQQTMFEREDNSIQRRVADLENAGLSKYLAAGSGAAAGSVVSRSNTNDVNMGAALDSIMAINQIRQQRQETENKRVENKILNTQLSQLNMSNTLARMNLFNQLGLDYEVTPDIGDKGDLVLTFAFNTGEKALKKAMPFFELFDYDYKNLKNSADLLQKDVDFYDADKFASYLLPLLRLGTGRR